MPRLMRWRSNLFLETRSDFVGWIIVLVALEAFVFLSRFESSRTKLERIEAFRI